MHKLLHGVRQFQTSAFNGRQQLFQDLASGQSPLALFITCSDSRIDPNLLTQTEPGELFVLRTAGNIVPPHRAVQGGEAATIEYAVSALKVQDIVLCGHSHCGAVAGLLNPESTRNLPAVSALLQHAESTRRCVEEDGSHLSPAERLMAAVQLNVIFQLDNLRTHPAVAAALARRRIRLHGWVYQFETGDVLALDPQSRRFLPLHEGFALAEAS